MENSTEPAYPNDTFYGLTKREYFAGLAMQGMLAGVYCSENAWNSFMAGAAINKMTADQFLAKSAVEKADELLKALEPK